jgi:hypothetical protein
VSKAFSKSTNINKFLNERVGDVFVLFCYVLFLSFVIVLFFCNRFFFFFFGFSCSFICVGLYCLFLIGRRDTCFLSFDSTFEIHLQYLNKNKSQLISILTKLPILFSFTKFFKYTEATFIGVKGYIFFCLLGSTGSHCFEIFCVWM